MLKFVKHHMDTIAGIEVFPLISLVIFFAFFVGLFIYIARADKKQINEISRIPLDSNADNHELT
ncbi:CcoQ/FixQ family Cbb3-type cytochrome c oxidase assembly chaperone [Marinoscillum sp.]|uniref:CcoQ/FixQ family Cbb3-type cytochrome c oxidase assembly chaperone n=1 Tax=Marinoscillum sp. TaxID=2024838 RepID=UPI003BA9E955